MFRFMSRMRKTTYLLEFQYEWDPGDEETQPHLQLAGVCEAYTESGDEIDAALFPSIFEELHSDGDALEDALAYAQNSAIADGYGEAHVIARTA